MSLETIEVAPPKAHEVRIEIFYTGVCHTGILTFMLQCAWRANHLQMPTHFPEKIPRELSQLFLVMRELVL